VSGNPARHRPNRGAELFAQGERSQAFRSGRHFAAWLGLTPRENSSGGRHRPGRIGRQGDEGLRRLVVLGATAVIRFAKPGRAVAARFAGAAAPQGRRRGAGQQDGADPVGHDGEGELYRRPRLA
jgi:transposase